MERATLTYQFDDITVSPEAFQVSRAGRLLALEPKAIRVLLFLLGHRHRAVGKDELLAAVWEDTAVTDNALTRVIAQLRKALGDNSREPKYIETVPTLGYRFIANVGKAGIAPPVSIAPEAAPRRKLRGWTAVAAVLVAASLALIWRAALPAPATHLSHTTQFTTAQGLDLYPTYSPDGSAIAYCSDRSGWFEIFVRPTALGGREIQVTNDGEQNIQPVWSPDGRSIAYTSASRRGIYLVPALGGPPVRLTTFGSTPTWSPDGSTIAFRSEAAFSISIIDPMPSGASVIWSVPATGGEPRPLAAAQRLLHRQTLPRYAPDGRLFFVIYEKRFGGGGSVWWCRPESGDAGHLPAPIGYIHDLQVSPDGRFLFLAGTGPGGDGELWRMRTDGSDAALLLRTSPARTYNFALSRDGRRIAYTLANLKSNLWRLPLNAAGEPSGPPEALTHDVEQRNTLPILSPDGKHIAWFVNRLGLPGRVWVADIDGSNAFPLTTDATPDSVASWLADGSSVAIAKIGPQTQVLSISLADRSRRPLVTIPMRVVLPRLAPDGRSAVFHNVDGGVPNIWKVALDGSPPIALTQDPEGAIFPSWSQDGGWIAFQLIRGDDAFVAVMPAAGGVPVQLTTMPGKSWSYSWAPDNDRIAFAGFDVGQWQIYSVSRTTREVRKLTSFHDSNGFVRYPAWSADGRRIVFEHAESAGNIFAADLVTDNLFR